MPAIPPGLSEWLALLTQPAVILLGVGLIVSQQNRLIDAMGKRIDELREDMKAMDARQREDNKALNEKLDRLLEARLSKLP
ncbi:MAG: hypothetical protein F4Y87_08780 [Synechococcus sp. SB0665_bin_28]|nr:hypothetical protein [Synechococcus sp. SB0665_bin_28]MYF19613.1 hypothetical protein [Synechococcus sp. SB0677_bin_5]MYF35498.1 hypothetical protein [Synechococcus sp. SB0678_bin_12]MYI87356.1 hypothetical protein [Synechococcus sp. SB0672_bin_10]